MSEFDAFLPKFEYSSTIAVTLSPRFEVSAGPRDRRNKHVFVGVAEKPPCSNRIHYVQVL
jgi:hypothetical protein